LVSKRTAAQAETAEVRRQLAGSKAERLRPGKMSY